MLIWSRLRALITALALATLFYVVVTPVGLVLRLLGRDTMTRSMDEDARSYRRPSHMASRDSMEKPF